MTIELLISILIMSVMSTVVLSANSTMSARLQTDNLAHLIALTIREAQTRALSATVPVGATAAPGYGVYITTGDNDQITLFSESSPSYNEYRPDYSVQSAPPLVIGQGFTISQLGARDAGGAQQPGSVSIFFRRPSPDAVIKYGAAATPGSSASEASIVVRAPKAGITKTIRVTTTGQISVQ